LVKINATPIQRHTNLKEIIVKYVFYVLEKGNLAGKNYSSKE
jgi:hypothetical protein